MSSCKEPQKMGDAWAKGTQLSHRAALVRTSGVWFWLWGCGPQTHLSTVLSEKLQCWFRAFCCFLFSHLEVYFFIFVSFLSVDNAATAQHKGCWGSHWHLNTMINRTEQLSSWVSTQGGAALYWTLLWFSSLFNLLTHLTLSGTSWVWEAPVSTQRTLCPTFTSPSVNGRQFLNEVSLLKVKN